MRDTQVQDQSKPLIIYTDDNGEERITYSNYNINGNTITFETQQNKITLPLSRLIKIKEAKGAFV